MSISVPTADGHAKDSLAAGLIDALRNAAAGRRTLPPAVARVLAD